MKPVTDPITVQKMRAAIAALEAANPPQLQDRLFVFDPRTPLFKKLKRQKKIREVEPGIWEVI